MANPSPPEYPVPDAEDQRMADLHAYRVLTAPEGTYEDLTRLAAQLCQRPMAAITFIDEHRQWVKAEVGGGAQETDRSESFCAHAIADPEDVYVVEDATEHPAFADNPYVRGEPGIRFYAGAPVTSHRGHALGTICVMDTEPGTLSSDERAALEALGRTVSLQLELRRQGRQLRRARDDMQLFASTVGGDVQDDIDTVQTALQTLGAAVDDEDQDLQAQLQDGKRATRRLARILGSLEEYVRIAGRRDPTEAVPLGDALEEARAEIEAQDTATLPIQAHGLPVVWADRHQLTALLRKLLVLLADLGSEDATIHVSAHRGEDRWRVELSTDAAEADQATRKAFHAGLGSPDPTGPDDAWGLGLCRRIVDHHGGDVGVEDPGDGRLGVWFTLPGPERETAGGPGT